ncbi:S-adenosylmethionine-binding domain-containing protein [Polynucleobacter sp. IMCC 29146]|uniref:S-adenosylmethionine-binding domain-containing protein n=1 Tax=Polynucleobacter sp. IMCC 29146 TaxID=2780953 RepID=UPI001F372DC5|nr:S-adenosylmethionine-binding domain-containing protein [Polynucleobacter sp. IMCC 29146]
MSNAAINKKTSYPTKKYKVLIIDPPWPQGKTGKRGVRPNQGTKLDYPTMTKQELLQLPVESWAEEQSFLFLWATNSKDKKTGEPILKMAFELMEKWGFTFYTMITWDKKTGPCPFGPYQITTEHILFGYRGKAVFEKASLGKMKTCFTESATAHSVKPNSFYELITKHFKGRKLDVFARQVRDGYDGWGNEYGMLSIDLKKSRKAKTSITRKSDSTKLEKLQAEMF